MADNFIFQQDRATAHTSRRAQEWLSQRCTNFITKDEWPSNSPDLNPLDFHVWGVMLQMNEKRTPKQINKNELKAVLEEI